MYVRIWHGEQMSLQTLAKGVQWWRWCDLVLNLGDFDGKIKWDDMSFNYYNPERRILLSRIKIVKESNCRQRVQGKDIEKTRHLAVADRSRVSCAHKVTTVSGSHSHKWHSKVTQGHRKRHHSIERIMFYLCSIVTKAYDALFRHNLRTWPPTNNQPTWHGLSRILNIFIYHMSNGSDKKTRRSPVAERPRDASCLSVISFNI